MAMYSPFIRILFDSYFTKSWKRIIIIYQIHVYFMFLLFLWNLTTFQPIFINFRTLLVIFSACFSFSFLNIWLVSVATGLPFPFLSSGLVFLFFHFSLFQISFHMVDLCPPTLQCKVYTGFSITITSSLFISIHDAHTNQLSWHVFADLEVFNQFKFLGWDDK